MAGFSVAGVSHGSNRPSGFAVGDAGGLPGGGGATGAEFAIVMTTDLHNLPVKNETQLREFTVPAASLSAASLSAAASLNCGNVMMKVAPWASSLSTIMSRSCSVISTCRVRR